MCGLFMVGRGLDCPNEAPACWWWYAPYPLVSYPPPYAAWPVPSNSPPLAPELWPTVEPPALAWPPCTPPSPLPVGWPPLLPLPPPPPPLPLEPLPPVRQGFTSSPQLSVAGPEPAPPPPTPPPTPPTTALLEPTWAWCMNALIVAWYSAGAVCTESGVESLGGVGGKEKRCWPVWPVCTWLSLSCGSCGQANGLPHALLDAIGFGGSLSQDSGPWKCGRQTCGDTCDVVMRDAGNCKAFLG
uniref:Uncharacterized protein n=1 Tax=Anopheles dirus TaxID=7168 RepID=A0A182ND13_9DIPT